MSMKTSKEDGSFCVQTSLSLWKQIAGEASEDNAERSEQPLDSR